MRKRWISAVGFAALGVAGVLAALFAVPSFGRTTVATATVNVTAKEFSFKLSTHKVGLGKVTFRVTNRGKIAHDFKIAGKKTKVLKPGASQSLTVTFRKSGRYPYLCTIPGHAAAGMKGVLAAGHASVPKPTTTTTTAPPTTTTTAAPPPGSIPVQVQATEFKFTVSQSTFPAGSTVFFTITNVGQIGHDFTIPSLGVATPVIMPGQSTTVTAKFTTAGQIYYVCDLPQHAEAGMNGFFTVTG